MPGLTFSNELISRDEGTHTVSSTLHRTVSVCLADHSQDFACLVSYFNQQHQGDRADFSAV